MNKLLIGGTGRGVSEIMKNIKDEDSYFLWGGGEYGSLIYQYFSKEVNLAGFIDSNPDMQGNRLYDLQVYSPSTLREKTAKVIITSSWTREIGRELVELGYKENIDYFNCIEWAMAYKFKKKHIVYPLNIGLFLTEKCSLCCESCMAYVPLIEKPRHMTIEEVRENLEVFFQYGEMGVLTLTGGDTFCIPHLKEILEYVGKHYYQKGISLIRVATNAIIMPDDELLAVLRKYRIHVRVTEYGSNAVHQNIPKFRRILEDNQITLEVIQLQQWFRIWRKPEEYLNTVEEKKQQFQKCDYFGANIIKNKKIYYCCECGADIYPVDNSDLFSLENPTEETKIELMQFLLYGPPHGYQSSCGRCFGLSNANQEKVKIAKQVKK